DRCQEIDKTESLSDTWGTRGSSKRLKKTGPVDLHPGLHSGMITPLDIQLLLGERTMITTIRTRLFVSLLVTFCLLVMPVSAFAKKGDAHFKKGMEYEAAQQWEKAAQEFTLAVAANPANTEYQLHFRRATFNASQAFMSQGRALAERRDYVG